MVPKLILLLGLNTVSLSEPMAQTQDSFVDSLLKFHRVVKSALGLFIYLRQLRGLDEPLERTAEPIFVLLMSFWEGIKKLSKGASG